MGSFNQGVRDSNSRGRTKKPDRFSEPVRLLILEDAPPIRLEGACVCSVRQSKSAVSQMENGAFCIVEVMGMSKGYCSLRTGSTWSWTSSLRAFWKCHISLPRMIMV